jgi:hypothetical protein
MPKLHLAALNIMKTGFAIIFLLSVHCCFAQQDANLNRIDEEVLSIEPASPGDLALALTAKYSTDLQKVRAIFSWVAEHIEYKTKKGVLKTPPSTKIRLLKPIDSVVVNSANEYVAEMVIRNQSGVCEGYARLFKTLCDYAGIECVLITGYARGDPYHIGTRFISNHYWNAVFVDSSWHLLDVTWASGYFNYYGGEFIKHFDDSYFFTPPVVFIKDHFPDDLQWTLLPQPPAPEEFNNSPFKQRAFIKYNLISFSPLKGNIETSPGDTLRFTLQTSDPESDKRKAVDTASLDSNMLSKYSSVVFLNPEIEGTKIEYEFVVPSENIKWLHLVYNKDVILRYCLNFKKK